MGSLKMNQTADAPAYPNKKIISITLLLFANFLFGALGVSTRILQDDYGLSLLEVTFLRQFFSLMTLALLLLIFDRKALKIRKNCIIILIAMGIIKIFMDYTLFFAFDKIPLGIATMLQMTSPFFVVIIAFFVFGSGITVKKLLAITLAIFGCILGTGLTENLNDISTIGVIAGLASGAGYAVYMLCAKTSADRNNSPMTTLFYTSLVATIVSFPFVATNTGYMFNVCLEPAVFADLLLLSIMLTIVPFYIVFLCVPRLGTTSTSIICMTEFIFSSLFGFLFYNEIPSVIKIAGMCLMMMSVVIISIESSEYKEKYRVFDKVLINAPSYTKKRKKIDPD